MGSSVELYGVSVSIPMCLGSTSYGGEKGNGGQNGTWEQAGQ